MANKSKQTLTLVFLGSYRSSQLACPTPYPELSSRKPGLPFPIFSSPIPVWRQPFWLPVLFSLSAAACRSWFSFCHLSPFPIRLDSACQPWMPLTLPDAPAYPAAHTNTLFHSQTLFPRTNLSSHMHPSPSGPPVSCPQSSPALLSVSSDCPTRGFSCRPLLLSLWIFVSRTLFPARSLRTLPVLHLTTHLCVRAWSLLFSCWAWEHPPTLSNGMRRHCSGIMQYSFKENYLDQAVIAQTNNLSIQEAETGGLPWSWGQP